VLISSDNCQNIFVMCHIYKVTILTSDAWRYSLLHISSISFSSNL